MNRFYGFVHGRTNIYLNIGIILNISEFVLLIQSKYLYLIFFQNNLGWDTWKNCLLTIIVAVRISKDNCCKYFWQIWQNYYWSSMSSWHQTNQIGPRPDKNWQKMLWELWWWWTKLQFGKTWRDTTKIKFETILINLLLEIAIFKDFVLIYFSESYILYAPISLNVPLSNIICIVLYLVLKVEMKMTWLRLTTGNSIILKFLDQTHQATTGNVCC